MVIYDVDSSDDIIVGTKVWTGFTNKHGVVIKCNETVRDCDGSYGPGFVIQFEGVPHVSEMAKTEIDIWYSDKHVCGRERYRQAVLEAIQKG